MPIGALRLPQADRPLECSPQSRIVDAIEVLAQNNAVLAVDESGDGRANLVGGSGEKARRGRPPLLAQGIELVRDRKRDRMIRLLSRHGKLQQRQQPFADFQSMAVVFVGLDSHALEPWLLLV
jgi:hypothetical protein